MGHLDVEVAAFDDDLRPGGTPSPSDVVLRDARSMLEAEIPSIVPVPAAPPTASVALVAATIIAEFRNELAELGAEVDRVRQDAGFRRALDTAARFWRYSPCNQ